MSLKPWPSRRTLHRTITAVLDVMAAHDLSFEDVAYVDVMVGAVNRPWCQPVRTGLVPRHRIDLLNNMLFAVGAAIRHRDVKLRLYCDPQLADDVVTQAVPKVRWHDDGAAGVGAISEQGRVRIVTVGGGVHEGRCEVPLGHPARPMSAAQLRAKFVECAANAVRPVGEARAGEIVEVVMRLEELGDVGALMRLLV